MFLYFNKEGKLQTSIAHGSPVRQGDSFGLYVCFDTDYFKKNDLLSGSELLYMAYKKPDDNSFIPFGRVLDNLGSIKFRKMYDSEVTYKLVDGTRYITYYIKAEPDLTTITGDLQIVFSFKGPELTYSYDSETGEYILSGNPSATVNLSAKIYVEPTYGKTKPVLDGSIDMDNYNTLLDRINEIKKEKNVALTEMDHITTETDGYATLGERADYIFHRWVDTRIGWLIVGVKNDVTAILQENEYNKEIKNTDLFLILDSKNMLVIDGETGIMWNYNLETVNQEEVATLTQLSYDKIYFDTLLGRLQEFLNEISTGKPQYNNLALALRDFLARIIYMENNANYGIQYTGIAIQQKIGKDGEFVNVVTNDRLRTDLNIKNIEDSGTFGVRYTDMTLKAKNGYNSEETDLFTADSLKADMNLDRVHNKASDDVVSDTSDLIATLKAVHDALENPDAENLPTYAALKEKVEAIMEYINLNGEDSDNIINKLQEVIDAFDGMPEELDLMDWLNNIYNKIGESRTDTDLYDPDLPADERYQFTIKGRLDNLEENADKHVLVILRYEDNQELFTLDNWIEILEPNETYPEAICYAQIQDDEFKNIEDMEIVFDKTMEQEYLLGADVDTTTGTITIYATEFPTEDLTIDTIKMISNLYHTRVLSLTALRQIETNRTNIASNTNSIQNLAASIADINNNKLPQYLKKEAVNPNNEDDNSTIRNSYSGVEIEVKENDEQVAWFSVSQAGSYMSYTDTIYGEQSFGVDREGFKVITTDDNSNTHELTFDVNGELKVNDNPVVLKNTDANTNGQVKSISVEKTGAKLTIKGATDYDRQIALINDSEVVSGQVQSETYSRGKIDTLLSGKQNNLSETQLNAVNSGITAQKVTDFTNKQDALSQAQLNAVDSGITAEKVTTFTNKQDALSQAQLNAVDSGITAEKVETYDGYASGKQNKISLTRVLTKEVKSGARKLSSGSLVTDDVSRYWFKCELGKTYLFNFSSFSNIKVFVKQGTGITYLDEMSTSSALSASNISDVYDGTHYLYFKRIGSTITISGGKGDVTTTQTGTFEIWFTSTTDIISALEI